MGPPREFLVGVIEGFYGRAWTPETRLAYPDYLARAGLNTCLYCPKEDPYLRKRWQQHWPGPQWRHLLEVAALNRRKGILWGVGLSPFALYRNYDTSQRRQLRRKVEALAALEAPLLAILFDDMPGNLDALASRQAEIVADVVAWLPGVRVLACPTYYSFDPVLERHFGPMPADYWPRLGREMPPDVDIFWTGNRVCSESLLRCDIEAIEQHLGRPVMLWDNYPVNDGAIRSNFLYCSKLSGRDAGARELLSGHLCNAMNQGALSLPALTGLAQLYGYGPASDDWLGPALGENTWRQLARDAGEFEQLGRSGMGEPRCRELARVYEALANPAASEVASWLRGDYAFDPQCLTD